MQDMDENNRDGGGLSRRMQEKRDQIIAAAEMLFHDQGYGRVSMDQIHSMVGGSKRTLYSHFSSKEELFRAIMAKTAGKVLDAVKFHPRSGAIDDQLVAIATNYLRALLSREAVALFRAVVAEGRHFPDLMEMFLESGPRQVARQLADFLSKQQQAGTMRLDDIDLAAHQFLGMLRGNLHLLAITGHSVTKEEIDLAVRVGVQIFLNGTQVHRHEA